MKKLILNLIMSLALVGLTWPQAHPKPAPSATPSATAPAAPTARVPRTITATRAVFVSTGR
jgi:hypothetical protein